MTNFSDCELCGGNNGIYIALSDGLHTKEDCPLCAMRVRAESSEERLASALEEFRRVHVSDKEKFDALHVVVDASEMDLRAAQTDLRFHPRAARLMYLRIPFIVVSSREPYYATVYSIIRRNEMAKGTWNAVDEECYHRETDWDNAAECH